MKPILEINPRHPIVERMKSESDASRFSDWSHILFDQATLAGEITAEVKGNGTLIKTGAETLTLSGNNSYSGGTTVDEGELIVSADSLGTGDVSLADDTTLTFNETGSKDFSGTISGSGKVVKDGIGSVTLEKSIFNANDWSGGTEVNDGTLISKGIGGLPG